MLHWLYWLGWLDWEIFRNPIQEVGALAVEARGVGAVADWKGVVEAVAGVVTGSDWGRHRP